MSNSEVFVYHPRRFNNRFTSVLTAIFSVLVNLVVTVNSQTDMLNYCGTKPCIEPVRMSCQEMMDRYQFQGSCCSMQSIPQTGGCRITVSFGNCFWYPWCGTCEKDEEDTSRCNNIFETDADQRPCPDGDFDPVEIQKSENYTIPSCAPSMAPTNASMAGDGDGGSSASITRALPPTIVLMTSAAAVLAATLAAAFVGA